MPSLFDMHVHTNQGSPDSGLTPQEMVDDARRLGITGIMVTEHDGWPRHDFEEFERTVEDIVLIRALEVYTPLGHVITMGLEGHVAGYGDSIEVIRTLRREVDKVGGFMILAHPFRFLFDLPHYTQNMLFQEADKIPKTAEEASKHPCIRTCGRSRGSQRRQHRGRESVRAGGRRTARFLGNRWVGRALARRACKRRDGVQGRRQKRGRLAGSAARGGLRTHRGLPHRQADQLRTGKLAEAGHACRRVAT